MAAASTSPSDAQTSSGLGRESEPSLDVELLKEIGKKALIDALNSVNGAKTLVLDPTLAGPLGLVTEVALLKHHGVDKMFWLEPGPLSSTTSNIVYLCRPLIKYVKILADQIKRHAKESLKHRYTLFLVPRTSTLVTRILEEEGVLGDVTISSYNLQFIPIAEDVVSLESDNAFKEIWVDGDETVIYNSALALDTLQKLYGPFPRIVGKGDHASRLATLLTKPLPEQALSTTNIPPPAAPFDSLIILDRQVDMITPLLTQLTYEGLIDELIGLRNSQVELPLSLLTPPAAPNPANPAALPSTSAAAVIPVNNEKMKKHHLTAATDPLFAELRDLNFSSVGKSLNKVAHRLDEDYKARFQAKTPAQLRDFVGKLGGLQTEHQALRLHTGLSEMLVPVTRTDVFNKSLEIQQNLLASYEVSNQISAIEDLIAQGADMQVVVRLLCLASITAGGIKAKSLESAKRELLQAYGYNYLPLLLSLSAPPLSILLPNPLPVSTVPSVAASKYPFTTLRKSLRLLIDDNPEALDEVENDISFVYSGYAPISIRLIQCVAQKNGVISNPAEKNVTDDGDAKGKGSAKKLYAHPILGWKGFEDVLAAIPGKTFDIVQKVPGGDTAPSVTSLLRPHEQTTTTIVFFLGGCTYTEIAALRWVSRQNRGRKFLIATTGIVSGGSLIQSIAGVSKKGPGSKDTSIYSLSTRLTLLIQYHTSALEQMAPRAESKTESEKPARKTKSSAGSGGRKKLSAFNKFMQSEMARLKETEPDMAHQERFKLATANWKTAKENPRATA
ncbi:Sec1-like protein [Leucogyrophana mollusca]|uniref:Sec1-like protein n=1 Tax=Leucogyrophana mollusca TaxID=85980 RepID=A0ACB8BAS4_9AGAM|nr:Sec1-like protein [Leucogyrophana mollusca]